MNTRSWLWVRRVRPTVLRNAIQRLLNFPREEVVLKDGRRYLIDPMNHIGEPILTTGDFEPELSATFQALLGPGDTFLDCGANEGYHSILAAKAVGKTGLVIAIEPNPKMAELISRNALLNDVVVEICAVAFDEKDGSLQLWVNDFQPGSASIVTSKGPNVHCVAVPAVRGDAYLSQRSISRIRLAKLDCEGAESRILLGLEDYLRSHKIEALSVDYHPSIVSQATIQALHRNLIEKGYQLVRTSSGPWLYLSPSFAESAKLLLGGYELVNEL